MLSPHNSRTNGQILKILTPIVPVKCRIGHTSFSFWNLLLVRSGKFIMAAENNVFLNNSRSNGQIFKIPTAYVHYRWHAHLKNSGSQNLLPVCSGKFKMATENNVFLNNSRTNGHIFKIPTAYVLYRWHTHVKFLVLKIYSGKFKIEAENRGFAISR